MAKRKRNTRNDERPESRKQEILNLEDQARVNFELANELLSVLREQEGQIFDIADGHRYINYETGFMAYSELRTYGRSEPALLIKNKRRLDFMQWAQVADTGNVFRGVKLVTTRPDYQPTKEEREKISRFEAQIIEHLFFPPNETTPNFGKFLGTAYSDFFDLDDITLEIRYSKLGRPMGIHLQDPIIYKPVIKRPRYSNFLRDHELDQLIEQIEQETGGLSDDIDEIVDPDYLLVYQGKKIAGVDWNRVRKFHFFTQSDFRKAQRGFSIVEQGWKMLSYIMQALTSNASNFTNNRLPPGFFAFTGGGVSPVTLEKMKKIFYAYNSGANNSNRFPMVALNNEHSDVKWVGVRGNSKDLEYHQYMTLLFSIFCQLSGTDPREVSLGAYGDAVAKSSLFQDSSDGIIKESKDLGAKTFLKHLEAAINSPNKEGENIFKQLTGMDLRLEFTGFEIEDKSAKNRFVEEEIRTSKSINDILAENEEEKAELKLGDVNIYDVKAIANPQIFQALMFKTQTEMQQQQAQMQQQQQGAPGGMPPEGGAPGEEQPGADQQPNPDQMAAMLQGQPPPEEAQEAPQQANAGQGDMQAGQTGGAPPQGSNEAPGGQPGEELTPEELKFIQEMQTKGAEIDPDILEQMKKQQGDTGNETNNIR